MLKLDANIRANAATGFSPFINESDIAQLPTYWGLTQQEEANVSGQVFWSKNGH